MVFLDDLATAVEAAKAADGKNRTNVRLEPRDPRSTGPTSLWFRVAR